jgi:CBS domain containing-hemolysin-like protein
VAESGTGWIMGGGVTLDRLEQATSVKLDRQSLPPGTNTLDDWVMALQNRPPKGGDVIRNDQLRVIVRKVRRQLVLEAQVNRVT